jgi:hypothetical protein
MPKKRYPTVSDEASPKQFAVGEATARAYGREGDGKTAAHIALSIAAAKRRLRKPIKRSQKDIAWALEIAGIGEGPSDLSEKTRKYLYSAK